MSGAAKLPDVEVLTLDELVEKLPQGVKWFETLDHAAYHFVMMAYFESVCTGISAEQEAGRALADAKFVPIDGREFGEEKSVAVVERVR